MTDEERVELWLKASQEQWRKHLAQQGQQAEKKLFPYYCSCGVGYETEIAAKICAKNRHEAGQKEARPSCADYPTSWWRQDYEDGKAR